MGWITPELLFVSKLFVVLSVLAAMLYYCVIKSKVFDAELCEDKNGDQQNFVGGVMGHFPLRCIEKHGKEMKIKDLNPAEEGDFLCKLSSIRRTIRTGIL